MTDPATIPPPTNDTLPPVGEGREYRFGELVTAAWRNVSRMPLRVVIVTAVLVVILTIAGLVSSRVVSWLVLSGASPGGVGPGRAVLYLLGGIPLSIVHALVVLGYTWAVVRSYDRPKMRIGDMFRPWRARWLGRMLLLALMIAVARHVATVLVQLGAAGLLTAVERFTSSGPASPPSWLLLSVLPRILADGAVTLLSLLVGPIMLAEDRPRLWRAIGRQWRILRGQPWRIVAVVALWAGGNGLLGSGLTALTWWTIGSASVLYWAWAFTLTGTIPVAWTFVCLHLVAAFFRAVYGWPLETMRGRATDAAA